MNRRLVATTMIPIAALLLVGGALVLSARRPTEEVAAPAVPQARDAEAERRFQEEPDRLKEEGSLIV